MPIFLAASATRKILFRLFVVAAIVLLFGATFLFAFHLLYFVPDRAPLSYTQATDQYYWYHSAASTNKIALTFDDGPNKEYTGKIMDSLERHSVPGTFFFVGKNVLSNPEIVKDTHERGFLIGNHSFTHNFDAHDSHTRLALELHSTGFLIERLIGEEPTYYRPPFLLSIGIDAAPNPHIDTIEANTWAMEQGYLPVGIDIDTKDWLAHSAADVAAGLKNNVKGGHIVLLHDNKFTAEEIDELIVWLKENGYSIVTLDELLVPPTNIALASTLRPGMTDVQTGGDVSKLQWFLYQERELDPYELSGVFDEVTQTALLRFQVKNGLINPSDVDPARAGIADAATRNLIASISATHGSAIAQNREASVGIFATIAAVERGYIYLLSHGSTIFKTLIVGTLLLGVIRILFILGVFIFKKPRRYTSYDIRKSSEIGISVLIPAYNEVENIRSAVESIVHNTHKKKEIIVIDDGSKDATGAVVQAVIQEYPGEAIQLLTLENGGKARALNIGLTAAQYDIVAVLDADAVFGSGTLAAMVRHFDDPVVGAVAGKVYTTAEKNLLDQFQALEYIVGQNIDKEAFSRFGVVGVVPGPAGAWRKQAIMEAGGFDTATLAEDQDMTLSVLRLGYRIEYDADAKAYTETPHTIRNFFKQRFRWVFGTVQCFWKHKGVMFEQPTKPIGFLVLPNALVFGIILPLVYPLMDTALILGLLLPGAKDLLFPFLLFTSIDLIYTFWGLSREKGRMKLLLLVPFQRILYRQLLYCTVVKSVVCAIEGTGTRWNKFAKVGNAQRFFVSTISNQTQTTTTV